MISENWQEKIQGIRELVDTFHEDLNQKIEDMEHRHDRERVNLFIAKKQYDKMVRSEGRMNVDRHMAVSEAQARRRAYSRDRDFLYAADLDNIQLPLQYNDEKGRRRTIHFNDKDLY